MADMKIPCNGVTAKDLNARGKNTMAEHLEIEFTVVNEEFIEARMPVTSKILQPAGIVHGGANAALAETVASVGSSLCLEPNKRCVGLDLNVNHLRQVREGFVTARAHPLHLGRKVHLWDVSIRDDKGKLSCTSRLTLAIIDKEG